MRYYFVVAVCVCAHCDIQIPVLLDCRVTDTHSTRFTSMCTMGK